MKKPSSSVWGVLLLAESARRDRKRNQQMKERKRERELSTERERLPRQEGFACLVCACRQTKKKRRQMHAGRHEEYPSRQEDQ